MTEYKTAAVTIEISDDKLAEIKTKFETVHYYPDGEFPDEYLASVDIWYPGLPTKVTSVEQVPRTKIVQLASAGANVFLAKDIMKTEQGKQQISVCSASGIHSLSIPQYIVANIVNLYMKAQVYTHLARTHAKWPQRTEILKMVNTAKAGEFNRSLFGKTVGMLGYGHIARETARLLKAFNCEIIAANSKGDRRPETGYAIPGTGDPDGSLPSEFYSTTDPKSFEAFLSRCDVLVASLPSTPATKYMLTPKHFDYLPTGAILINVGRGDLVKSEYILQALDAPNGLAGAALDVTDPEPLPDGHPLFTHPHVIVTPHASGNFEGYYDGGADVLLFQIDRLNRGESPVNVVDPAKGY
ncbi:D-isomer specific 2-hydroxyacid dehydrogenase [Naematelia encephala]|uniref:D-isomer specific 2-hydroxyacid dehydrogenase n=1 Tax=Naematelia encephala TaxID=71784 RepID=A0A1Y2B081_9TREE|nr:D-isomer specific 2-hydroxyacid dehydrogenase [Naematelia encephala]